MTEFYKIGLGSLNFNGIKYTTEVSKYVKEDEAVVIQQNANSYSIISGRKLEFNEVMYVLNKYEVEKYIRELKRT